MAFYTAVIQGIRSLKHDGVYIEEELPSWLYTINKLH